MDDSFIFYRYAENLEAGHGFVFNIDEISGEGFTSWIWLLLLTFFQFLKVNIIYAAKGLGLFFHFSAVFFIYKTIVQLTGKKKNSSITAGIISGIILTNFSLIAHSVSGMETALYIFSLSILAYLTTLALKDKILDLRWYYRIGLISTFLFLVRPEGIVAGAMSFFILFLHSPRALLKLRVWFYLIISVVAPILIFLFWKYLHFGYPFPHSFYHKAVINADYFNYSLKHFLNFFRDFIWLIIPAFFIFILKSVRNWRLIYLYFTTTFFIMVLIYLGFIPVMNYMNRFYIPYLLFVLLMLSPGVSYLVKKISQWHSRILTLGVIIIGFFLLTIGLNSINYNKHNNQLGYWTQMTRQDVYRGKMGVLMKELPHGTTIANTEMGVIPFYSKLKCIDLAGLTDPTIAHKGLSIKYLQDNFVDIILFPMDIEKMSKEDLEYRQYGKVFLSGYFKKNFILLGTYKAWPNIKSNYYIYVNKTSTRFVGIKKWIEIYTDIIEND